MQQVAIAGTSLRLSRLGFGTAALHHLASRQERERLLRTAFDHGITHFDTSPYYGSGIAEQALAAIGAGGTIATKVGLYPPGDAHGSRARLLMRRTLGKLLPAVSRPIADLSVERARRSFHDSLRRLRRERVDLLLLHEPRIEFMESEEWRRWLELEKDRIGAIGVAGELERVLPFVTARSAFARVLQTRDSLAGDEAGALRRAGRAPDISYGHLVARNSQEQVADVLRRALRAHSGAVLLVSTRRVERIAEFQRGSMATEPLSAALEPT